jgi:hypothetical protein
VKSTISFSAPDVHDALARALSYARICEISVAAVRATRNSGFDYSVTVEVEAPTIEALSLYELRVAGIVVVTNCVVDHD